MAGTMISEPRTTTFRDYRFVDRHWVVAANVDYYTHSEGFDPSFADAVSDALDFLETKLEEVGSKFIIVETDNVPHPVGCVFFAAEASKRGRLRLFYLDNSCRGDGIGKRLLEEIIDRARALGFEKVCVSTFDRHEAACGLYRTAGFREQIRAPAMSFGQEMRQIDFEKLLPDHSR